MSNIIIKAENLSKQYRLGTVGTGSFAHDINRLWYRVRGKDDPYLKIGETNQRDRTGNSSYVWALRDIDFEVEKGDVLGIIGRNGAGKSTLLKILSRTTAPSSGSIKLKGRLASLLEVGTGFHPELTGRENIFLNGAILGMTKNEVRSKFDEIVDFAGVERYIDTPVKRYSSGMYVRLAFGVAAHLEPEILVVDEVLAVGDAEFQKKALGKMKDVSTNHGRTVLFVSHNMGAMQSLCNKCMYLRDGMIIVPPSPTERVVDAYLKSLATDRKEIIISERTDRVGNGSVLLTSFRITDKEGTTLSDLISGQEVHFEMEFGKMNDDFLNENLEVAMTISREGEHLITILSNLYISKEIINNKPVQKISFVMKHLPLMTGAYTCNTMLRSRNIILDWVIDAFRFEVENGDYYNSGRNHPETHKGVYFDFGIICQ